MSENETAGKTYSSTWTKRFDFFKQYGAPNTQTYNDAIKALPLFEKATIGINWWAFFFTFIYFFIKGMWKKALVLIGVIVVLNIISFTIGSQAVATGLSIFISLLAAKTVNYSFYREEVLKEDDFNLFEGLKL